MNAINGFASRNKVFWLTLAAVLMAVVGALDYLTGYELAFSLFYLPPIGMVAWFAGRAYGIPASIVGASVWFLADVAAGQQYSHPIIRVWNAGIRFGFFITATLLLSALKKALEHARELSRTDYQTGATSAGYFDELLRLEIERSARHQHPFTLAYLDIDDFKIINDRFGHRAGDEVLRTVVRTTRNRLRQTDTVARMGGDEFAILLPETDQAAAPVAISEVQQALRGDPEDDNRSVTCSIGAITFIAAPGTTDEALGMADELMYAVKKGGKDGASYSVYTGPHPGGMSAVSSGRAPRERSPEVSGLAANSTD